MKDIKELVKDFLAENYSYAKQEDDNYHFKIYTDYRDEIDDLTAQEILEYDNPREVLLEKLWDWYQTSEWDIWDDLVDEFKKNVDPELFRQADIIEDGNLDDTMIRDELIDIIYVDYPVDWTLGQEFCFNIIVSNGDDNYDFCLNEYIIDDDGNVDKDADKAGIVWLTKQQGHALEELVEVLKDEDNVSSNGFLASVASEIYDGYGCEALTFCVKMTLGQAIALKEKMKESPNGAIILNKNVTCGLFDMWSGGGSLLDVACEKDVEIPFANIWKLYIDKRRSNEYGSIHNVYGVDSSLWKNYLKEIKP